MKRELATVDPPQAVCEAVDLNREKALRVKKDVERLGRRGIALEHCRDVRAGCGQDRSILGCKQTKGGQQGRDCSGRSEKARDATADRVCQAGL